MSHKWKQVRHAMLDLISADPADERLWQEIEKKKKMKTISASSKMHAV